MVVNELISGPHFDAVERRRIAERNVERSFRPDAVARQTAAIMASPDRTDALGAVQVPTLVVHGLLDRLVKPSGGIATARAMPTSRLVMFPDMAHDLPTAPVGRTRGGDPPQRRSGELTGPPIDRYANRPGRYSTRT